jgi:hypothetical protein
MSDYLEKNLLPLILAIEPVTDESDIFECLGGDTELTSQSSCRIQFGNQIEKFVNKVISDVTTNLLEEKNYVIINGEQKQVDHLFITKGGIICYLESKCNLNFDSEKVVISNAKVKLLAETFGNVVPTYFVPVRRQPRKKHVVKYSKKGIDVVGMEWLAEQIDLPFTVEEYFTFLEEVVGPIMEEKGMILKNINK